MFKDFKDIQEYYKLSNKPYTKNDTVYLKLCNINKSADIDLKMLYNPNSSFSKNVLIVLSQNNEIFQIVDTKIPYNELNRLTPKQILDDSMRLIKKDKTHKEEIYRTFLKIKNLKKFITIQNLRDKL